MLGNQTFHVFCSFEKYLLSNFPSCISSLVSASCSTVGHQILFHPFSPLLPLIPTLVTKAMMIMVMMTV